MTATKIEQKFLGKSHRNNKRQSANLLDCRHNEFKKKKKKKNPSLSLFCVFRFCHVRKSCQMQILNHNHNGNYPLYYSR